MTTLALATGERPTLRGYQEEALARTEAAEDRLIRRYLGVAATGLGKTCMFVAKAERVHLKGGRVLILAHRDELISQAVDKVRQWWPTADVGVVQGPRHEINADVVVASVQSLHTARLARISPHHFDGGLLVVDEAHHAAAVTYRAILDYFGCGPTEELRRDTGPILFGVTATADRGDGKGLDDIFDEIVFTYDILWGIRSGFLSDLRGVQVMMANLDLSRVKVRGGDYNEGQLGDALEAANAPEHVVAAWLEHAFTRKTIVFLPTIDLAAETAEEFRASGINAECVSGVPMEERRAMLRRFKNGVTQVITNCAILTEGFDEPAVDCIVVARPTKSRALYTQMVGRGTRRFPGKADCLVLDVVGAASTHDLATIPSLFGIEQKEGFFGGEVTVLEALDEQEEQQRLAGALIAREVELFHRLRERNRVVWVKAGTESFAANAGEGTVVLVPGSVDDLWTVRVLGRNVAPRTLMADVDLELAQGVGDEYVRKNKSAGLADPNAPWRKKKPSKNHIAAAAKWGIKFEKGMTAGQLSEAMDAAAARRRLRDYERSVKAAATATPRIVEPF